MMLLKAFLVGGALCAVGQIIIDKTRLTPARRRFITSPARTIALQPAPEPPAWTSCPSRSKTRRPQSS